MINGIKQHWISILLCVFVLALCLVDTSPMPEAPMNNFDKLVHFLMFFGVSGVFFFDATHYFRHSISLQRLMLGSLLYPILLGGGIELLQEYLSSTRAGDWMDFLFDCIGALIGFTVCLLINRRLPHVIQ